MADDLLQCSLCRLKVAKERVRIINRCRDKRCPLNDAVDTEWVTWFPERSKKQEEKTNGM